METSLYHRHKQLIVKCNIGLKTLLQHGISEHIHNDDLVYKSKRVVGKPSDQIKKMTKRYKVGYTVKPAFSSHSKVDQMLFFKTDYHLMHVKSIADCYKRVLCNTFDLH